MPTYEYNCSACGHEFEQFQSISAKPIRKCPACGKLKVKRLIGRGAGVIFKGSGFYQTDYRSSSYQQAAKAESGGSSTETKSESSTKASAEDSSKKATKKDSA